MKVEVTEGLAAKRIAGGFKCSELQYCLLYQQFEFL